MEDGIAILNTFGTGTTIADLADVLTRFHPDTRVGLFPMTGGGCRLAILDTEGDARTYLWYDL